MELVLSTKHLCICDWNTIQSTLNIFSDLKKKSKICVFKLIQPYICFSKLFLNTFHIDTSILLQSVSFKMYLTDYMLQTSSQEAYAPHL